LGPVKEHKNDCDVDGAEKIVKRAGGERVGTPEGFPTPFPNKVTLTDEREVERDSPGMQRPEHTSPARTQSNGGTPSNLHHGHTVKTIRPVCKTFLKFPYDRGSLQLEIPGVPGKNYYQVFWYLGSKKPQVFSEPVRLYYSPIRWVADIKTTNVCCEITLNAGEWDDTKREFKSPCRVRVNWAEWSQSQQNCLARELAITQKEARVLARQDSKARGWIFFVGRQDSEDPGLFHVDDFRFICCFGATMVWPNKKT
jgi:hypothetical protein